MKKKLLCVGLFFLLVVPGILYLLFPGSLFFLFLTFERNLAGYHQRGADIEGWHWEYLEGGHGDTLVLLHGFGGNKDHWTRIGRYLTSHFRVIAPDLPGFGDSMRPPQADYTIPAQVDRLHAFLRSLNIEAFHLGGNSMGGNLAGAYAARYPQNVISLFLLAPGGVLSAHPSEMHQIRTSGRTNPLIATNVAEYERLMDFVFIKRPFIPRAIKSVLVKEAIEHHSINRVIYSQLDRSRKDQGLERLLNGFTTPTLIVWGRADRVLHVSGADILKRMMPGAETIIFDAVGHLPMIEKPEETATVFLRFVENSTRADSG